jgi:hypothetical protein
MPTPGRIHRNDKLWGAVAEALVAAYALIGANGKLTSYRPFTDVDGKDIVIDLAGGFKDVYLQVKCALGLNRNGRIGGTVRLHRDHIPSDPKLLYVFCLLDRRGMQLTRIWVVPSTAFYKRAYRTELAKGMVQFNFDCHHAGDPKWDEFEVERADLGEKLVAIISGLGSHANVRRPQELDGRWLRIAA